jgi:hypothetical protein
MNLEEEFQKLMVEVLDSVQAKIAAGELSAIDGAELARMVRERTAPEQYTKQPWSSSSSACYDTLMPTRDDGWLASSRNCW